MTLFAALYMLVCNSTYTCSLTLSLLPYPNQNSEIAMECPLIPKATYLVTMRIKIDMEGMDGQPTPCETELLAGGSFDMAAHCPRLLRKTMHLDPDRDEYMDRWIQPGSIGKYGEWFWFR